MLAKITAWFTAIITTIIPSFALKQVPKVNKTDNPSYSETANITVMNYNVKVSGIGKYSPENRAPYLIKSVLGYSPDSVGFEEVSEDWMSYLKDGINGYACVGIGRDENGEGEASPIFYKKSKYKCIDSDTFWLSETPDVVSKGWDARYNRVCTYAILKNKTTGFTYAHFNAHFDHLGTVARNQSVALICKKIKELCPGIPVIFSGDLNADEGSEMYNRILESGMRDTKYLAKKTMDMGTYHGYSKITELTRTEPIDFIFVNAYCKSVKSYKVDTEKYNGIYPSDHHPVIVELTLKNK